MASEVIQAIFNAQDNISEVLNDISQSAQVTEAKTAGLDRQLQELAGQSRLSRKAFDELRDSAAEISVTAATVDDKLDDVRLALHKLTADGMSTDKALGELERSMNELFSATSTADMAVRDMESQVQDLAEANQIGDVAVGELETTLESLGRTSVLTSSGIQTLSRGMAQASISTRNAEESTADYGAALQSLNASALSSVVPQKAVAESVEKVDDEMDDASRSAVAFAGTLSTLNAISSATAFQFSSLSVNIGPFNIALRNALTQIPAILTGMSTMLALITSLITAFATLGIVAGSLVAGGALAFFQDFAKQFEETGQAVEALMGALKDLFVEALEPITNEANSDLFVDAIDMAAAAVNRFAQFVSQMRGDVLSFLGTLNLDFGKALEAMHDSFVMMQPILRGFIEFFVNDLPPIVVRFTQLTTTISSDINQLIGAFGALISELLDFASVILDGVTPVIVAIVGVLIGVFKVINALTDIFGSWAITMVAATIVAAKLISSMVGLAVALTKVNGQMAAQVGTGSLLGAVYSTLTGQALRYAYGTTTLRGAILSATAATWSHIKGMAASAASKVKSSLATAVLTTAYYNLIGAIKSSTAWQYISAAATSALTAAKWLLGSAIMSTISLLFGEAAASTVASVAMGIYTTVTSSAALATWALNAALAVLTSPILAIVAAVVLLIALFGALIDMFTGGAVGKAMNSFFGGIIEWIQNVIDKMKKLLSLGGLFGGGGGGKPDAADTDDIQTQSNVDLSFEDKVENNVDVQADPEDQAQLSRITKDALEEANSFARRQQGGQ